VRWGIGAERRLAGARQAEEDGGIHRVALGVVGRAMHRHHALAGQDVVQQREDRLLVLARVFRVGDQDQLLLEVQRDHRVCAAAVPFGIGLEARAVDDRELGYEGVKLRALGTAQQVADEQVVPRQFVTMRTSRRCSASAPP
jgi:hypothetical protein